MLAKAAYPIQASILFLTLGVATACGSSANNKNDPDTAIDSGTTTTKAQCRDGIQNGDETQIDCGGDCSPCSSACDPVTSIPRHECEALVAFYDSTGGDRWRYSNWLSDPDPCTWWHDYQEDNGEEKDTVQCTEGHVSELKFSGYDVSGDIPAEIGNLTELTNLTLGITTINGSIPPEIGNLSKLTRLALGQNQLTGSIPPEIGNLDNLEHLVLERNSIHGSIPAELGELAKLKLITFENNQLTGSIPPEIGNLDSLEHLNLSNNQLSGEVPSSLMSVPSFSTSLSVLRLSNNGCLTAATQEMRDWLDGKAPSWNGGCP